MTSLQRRQHHVRQKSVRKGKADDFEPREHQTRLGRSLPWLEPLANPYRSGVFFGPHRFLFHCFSDSLRRYSESIWYSVFECKRPTNDELIANTGILLTDSTIPTDILFAFYHQLENLFTISKVIQSIRKITDWLNMNENLLEQVTCTYELASRQGHFAEHLFDNLKSLKLCDHILDYTGSIYHRLKPLESGQTVKAKTLIDFVTSNDPSSDTVQVLAQHRYQIINNTDPHLWQLKAPDCLIPSLILEISTENGEQLMLQRLRCRMHQFLVMCYARAKRSLFNLITKAPLEINREPPSSPETRPFATTLPTRSHHYFAKSPLSIRVRCRSALDRFSTVLAVPAMASSVDDHSASPKVTSSNHFVRALYNWLYTLPRSSDLFKQGKQLILISSTNQRSNAGQVRSTTLTSDQSDVVNQLANWWARMHLKESYQLDWDRILLEAKFLQSLFKVITADIGIDLDKARLSDQLRKRSSMHVQFKDRPNLTKALIHEVVKRLTSQFYCPKSGQMDQAPDSQTQFTHRLCISSSNGGGEWFHADLVSQLSSSPVATGEKEFALNRRSLLPFQEDEQ